MGEESLMQIISKAGARSPFGELPAIVPREALQQAGELTLRSLDKWCEIARRRPAFSGGLGEDDSDLIRMGPFPCAIARRGKADDTNTIPAQGASDVTLNSDRIISPAFYPDWSKNTAYGFRPNGEPVKVFPTGFSSGERPYFKVFQEGTSGAIEPQWMEQLGAKVPDGTIVWECAGIGTLYEVLLAEDGQSNSSQRVVVCKVLE